MATQERQESGELSDRVLKPTAGRFCEKSPGSLNAGVGLPDYVSSASFGNDLFKTLFASKTPLGNFCDSLWNLQTTDHCSSGSKQLWPCPIPSSLSPPSGFLTGRRLSRYKLRVTVREHLRCFIASGNWLVLGRPKTVPSLEQPFTASQRRMLDDLESTLRLFYRLSSGHSSGLDRALGKYGNLSDSLRELSSATATLRQQLDSYSRGRSSGSTDFDDVASSCSASGGTVALSSGQAVSSFDHPIIVGSSQQNSSAMVINPERIQFKHAPSFRPVRFMHGPLLKAGFLDPRHLRLPEGNWPAVRPARVMCKREQLLRLFRKWDEHHCLHLVEASSSEQKYRCGLFAVYKNSEKDRQILNPIPENGRSMALSSSTLTLAHGSLLCNLFLDHDEDLLIGADDLEDFYHGFCVTPEHAHRNHIHGVFQGDLFKGWHAWNPSLEGKDVVACFNTLAMGTSFAVEVAQHTHSALLQRAGVLKPEQQVCYRKPLPRSPTLQLLCIDDLAILQKVPKGTPPTSSSVYRGDRLLLEKANRTYDDVGLRTSVKKAVRDSSSTVVLGGELDGRRGLVNAPRLRILTLAKLTLRLVRIGWSTKHLLEMLVGSWIFILLFRRPLLSILNDVFHEGDTARNRHEAFRLSVGARQELILVAMWAPFAFSNLRAQPLDQIFCTDASLHGAGVCAASFSRSATLEVARVAEQKGFYTRVDNSALGRYNAVHDENILDPPNIPKGLTEGFLWDFCEVFRGTGHLSAAHRAAGLVVHKGFEIRDGPHGNILLPATFLAIVGLIARRVVRCWHVAPVCTTFGTLRRPRLRSKLIPFGFNPDDGPTSEGNQFAMRGGFVLFLCLYYDLWVSCEQPGGSVMYRLDIFQRLLQHGFYSVRFPFCSYGTPFQKMSWWLSNNSLFTQLESKCHCGKAGRHFRVQGSFDHNRLRSFRRLCIPSVKEVFGKEPFLGEHVAHFSAGYPLPLCKVVAKMNLQMILDDMKVGNENTEKPLGSPPDWIGHLGKSLCWRKLIQYSFRKANHINVNEQLSYRSLLKHLAKSSPHSRFAALLDSRVVIGCNVKGRSSSKQLNYYLGSTLPYIIGGDLYPNLLHISSGDNASDDTSRFVKLRDPLVPRAAWLEKLLAGDHRSFEQVWQADKLVWPLSGWSRLIRLSILASCNFQSADASAPSGHCRV